MLFLLALLFSGIVPASEYDIAPAPSWVRQHAPGEFTAAQLRQASDGVAYLLVDEQVLASPQGRQRYQRHVTRALNARGVEVVANIGIEFDPSWQRLRLHAVRVLRDGRAIDKLPGARIEVIQQEKELEALIYNGSRTAQIFLPDVRVGDVIDYSFSLDGRNPVFGAREFGSIDLQWGVPVARLRARLLLPAGQPLQVRTRNGGPAPRVGVHDGLREYGWEIEHTTPLAVEDDAPDWYSPYAEAEWSAYGDWSAVARWAAPLYRVPESLGPELEARARRIEAAEPTPVGRMLAVLRLVQAEVRYLGVETGRNSHAPNPPALVYARRFGDCKDKVLLAMSLLRRLGVDAQAALVNTRVQRGIAGRLPTPAAFDHVVLRARIGARQWWLDPTRREQQSDAEHLYQPDFGLALPVAPQATGLESMRNAASHSRRRLHAVFDARREFSGAVGFAVVTEYEGGAAEAQREELAGASLESLQQEYLGYYAGSYPGIRLAAPMRVADDRRHNRLVTTESYAIADLAGPPDAAGRRHVLIRNPDVAELLGGPDSLRRSAPLRLEHPLELRATTQVLLPGSWSISESEARVEDPAFSYRRRVRAGADHRRLVIEDDYRTLSDEVAAPELPRYAANLARAREQLGYRIEWSDALLPPPVAGRLGAGFGARLNWALLCLSAFALLAFARLARRAWHYDPAPAAAPGPSLAGLRGVALPCALLVLAMSLFLAWQLWSGASAYGAIAWSGFTTFGARHYHPLWAPVLLIELLAQLGMLVACVLAWRLYRARRSSFPRLAFALLCALCAFQAAGLWLATALPGRAPPVGGAAGLAALLAVAAVCGAWLLRSRRVASTFAQRAGM